MRAARTVFGRNVGALHVESLHRRPPSIDSLAAARLRSAPIIFPGEPVITVGKKRVTPVVKIARMERAISSWLVEGEL